MALIAIDWGTTHVRAYRLAADGEIVSRRSAPKGIMAIAGGDFATALDDIVHGWENDRPIIMSGMIGSRQGWFEVPYLPCPVRVQDLASGVQTKRATASREVSICPGVVCRDADGVPDVMRGEEVQIFGALSISGQDTAAICLPGTHSKHAFVRNGVLTGFMTHMTGEVFALLRDHSILGRLMAPRHPDVDAFDSGVRRAQQQGGLPHHIFGVRTRALLNEVDGASLADYLSGILIGHELIDARLSAPVLIVGEPDLGALYQRALRHQAIETTVIAADLATTRGLHAVASMREQARP
jgi:2-dehydro-3-deoxygalactonokinase